MVEFLAPPPPAAPVPLPRLTGEDPLWHDLSMILPRQRGSGTMRSMVEGAQ
jgi:hypothetical protein